MATTLQVGQYPHVGDMELELLGWLIDLADAGMGNLYVYG